MSLLDIKGLKVSAGGHEILKGIDFSIEEGRTTVIFGPNGSGKSTLMGAILGLPGITVTSGTIVFKGRDITDLPVHERARMGIGLGFQYPPAVKGVRLSTLLDNIKDNDNFDLHVYSEMLNMDQYLDRDINLGFSGGERKRSEILQLMVQRPDLLLLDEPESGVDVENISIISKALSLILEKDKPLRKRRRSAIIITHTGYILDYIRADTACVIVGGYILGCGSPSEILAEIREKGYSQCMECYKDMVRGDTGAEQET